MKTVLDMNLSSRFGDWLRERGVDAVRWHELGAPDADDDTVLAWCRSHAACLVSQDADFARILFESGASRPSVIYLRDCDPVSLETWERVLALLRGQIRNLAAGCLLVVTPRHVRLRWLPIRPGYDPTDDRGTAAVPGL